MLIQISIFIGCLFINEISGHGMLLEPPNRSSLWRYNPDAPANYNDNENFCGGASVRILDDKQDKLIKMLVCRFNGLLLEVNVVFVVINTMIHILKTMRILESMDKE